MTAVIPAEEIPVVEDGANVPIRKMFILLL
jgi:hypothetical protein